jgi:hypothetical protein
MSETDLLLQQEKLRRMTMPHVQHARAEQLAPRSRGSFDSPRPTVPLSQRDHRLSLSQAHAAQAAMLRLSTSPTAKHQTMDYLHLDSHSQPASPAQARGAPHLSTTQAQQAQLYSQLQKGSNVSTAEWEALLGSIEGGQLNVYDAIYGGPGLALAETPTSATTNHTGATWSPNSWDLSGFNLSEFGPGADSSHSVVSLSEDGLSSSDDLVSVESAMDFRGGMMPVTTADGFVLDGLEGFGL